MQDNQIDRIRSGLQFYDYVVNKVEFYANEHHDGSDVNLTFRLQREIKYLDHDHIMHVTLHAYVFEGAVENNYPFEINVSVTGFFKISPDLFEDKDSLATTNAVAILFPYVRSLVTTFTGNANVNPLILPTVNVVKMIEMDI